MKGILDSTNNMSTKRFLEKFLSKKKDYNDEKDNILNNKSISKYNISDYHSTNWLEKFNEKKKDKFYYKAIEDINKIKASRNNSKKLTNKSNLINSYSKKSNVNNLKQKNYFTQRNNIEKKNFSLGKKYVNQMKLIKDIKEELKNNPKTINKKLIFDKNNEKDNKKIKNIKIERVISNNPNKKNSSKSLKINISNKKENLSTISISKTEISNNINIKTNKKKRINFYNKFKSQSGDLNKSSNNSQSKNIKKNLIKQIKIEKNLKQHSFLSDNNNNRIYNNTERNENKRFISKIKKKLDFNKNEEKENEKEKILYYKNMKIKIQENIKKGRKSKKTYKNKLPFSNLEIINTITTIKLKDNNKDKYSQLYINRPLSATEFSSIRVNSLKNKFRDLICEYESEIDS